MSKLGVPLICAMIVACNGPSAGVPDTSQDAAVQSDGASTIDTAAGSQVWSEDCPMDAPEFRPIDVGEVTLNVACQGSGPTLLFLHGFPEVWYGWHQVMAKLSTKYRLIVPDQRGVNVSDKPAGIEKYQVPHLVDDIAGLITAVSDGPVTVVGHDWGGVVAWAIASMKPELVERLVILNAPHPNVFAREYAENPDQRDASFYIELLVNEDSESFLEADDYAFLKGAFGGSVSDDDLVHYVTAWSQPGALTGMVNWYRANMGRKGPILTEEEAEVSVPTLVLWGLADTALLPGNLRGLDAYVPDLTVKTYEGVSHWIAHEIPDTIAAEIDAFVSAAEGEKTP